MHRFYALSHKMQKRNVHSRTLRSGQEHISAPNVQSGSKGNGGKFRQTVRRTDNVRVSQAVYRENCKNRRI